MATRPAAPTPFVAPLSGDIEQRMAQVAHAINRKADATATPSFSAIILLGPDRSRWQLSVDATGALSTARVG